MTRLLLVPLLALSLGGCAASMAASAVGMAVRGAQGAPPGNAHLRSTAVAACSDRAAAYGTVRVIDVEQRSPSKLIVWATVDDGQLKRSVECSYGTSISGFRLRPIAATR